MDRHACQEGQQRQPDEAAAFLGQQGQRRCHRPQTDQSRQKRMVGNPQANEYRGYQGGPSIVVACRAQGQPQGGQRQRCLQRVDLGAVADDHHAGREGEHHRGSGGHQHARDRIKPVFGIEPISHIESQGVDHERCQ